MAIQKKVSLKTTDNSFVKSFADKTKPRQGWKESIKAIQKKLGNDPAYKLIQEFESLTPKLCLILCLCLLGPKAFAGGAWGRKPQTAFAHFSYFSLDRNQFYGSDGKVKTLSKYQRNEVDFYSEFGLPYHLTTVFSLPLWMDHSAHGNSHGSFGDANLEMQYKLPLQALPMALGMGIGLPIGDHDRQDSLNTGDGEYDLLFKIYAAKPLWNGNFKVEGALGYHLRTLDYTDDYQYSAKLSAHIYRGTWASGVLRGQKTWKAPKPEKINPYLGFGEGVEYVSPGIEVFFPIGDSYHLSIGNYTALSARNIIAQSYFVMGLGFNL